MKQQIERPQVASAGDDAALLVRERAFTNQYSHLYHARFQTLSGQLRSLAAERWPEIPVVGRLLDVAGRTDLCIIVGTLFKQSKLRQSAIKFYEKQRTLAGFRVTSRCIHEDDYLVLEDESARARLRGAISVDEYVTGVVVAIRGHGLPNGDFDALEIMTPGMPAQVPIPLPDPALVGSRVAFVSGLNLGQPGLDELPIQMMTDWLAGMLDDAAEAARIIHVIVAGNSVFPSRAVDKQAYGTRGPEKVLAPVEELDVLLTELVTSVPVTLMPGPTDPTNYMLPQQPFHRLLLPQCARYTTYTPATNPHRETIAGRWIVGSSGQPVDDMTHYSKLEPLDVLERMLQWGHIAPTTPDITGCYPFFGKDPFLLEQAPHVFFTANQAAPGWRVVEGSEGQRVLCLLVPDFSKTHSIVVADLRTLACETITFGSLSGAEPAPGPPTTTTPQQAPAPTS